MIRPIKALVIRNLIKLSRDRMRLFFTLFMSAMFLFIFSFVTKSMLSSLQNPMNYLISGIIIMTVFQASLNNSMSILEDISSGFMKEILVAPIKRWQIAIGQVVSSTLIAVFQGLIIVIAGLFMGLSLDFMHAVLMILIMCLVGLTFSSLGLLLAAVTKESVKFQLLVSIVVFPLTFLSGAYIPVMAIPGILSWIVYLNPLTYTTAIFRFIMLHLDTMSNDALIKIGVAFNINGFIITPVISFLMVITLGSFFFVLCVKRFNTADFSRVKIFKHRR